MSDERVWRALSDPTRRAILDSLRVRPHTTGELVEHFEMTRYGVMKHLEQLVGADLVLVRRRGRYRWNHLNFVPLREAIRRWAGPFQEQSAEALLQLRDRVEAEAEYQKGEHMSVAVRNIQIEEQVRIGAPAERVFHALIHDTGQWWGSGYRLLDENSMIRIDPVIGGHMFETSGDAAASWGIVTAITPGQVLELSGRMGMGGAVLGIIRFNLEESGDGTIVNLSHHVTGDIDEDAERNYSRGWQYLLGTCLTPYVEGK